MQTRRSWLAAAASAVVVLGSGAIVARDLAVPEEARSRAAVLPSSPGVTPAAKMRARAGEEERAAEPAAEPVESTVKDDRRTLKVVSARTDLSGQRELRWAADEGRTVGVARCTQHFRFNTDSPVTEKPTMLLCWRTSRAKSVYTLAIDLDRRPSEHESVAVIDRVWAELG